MYVESKNPNKMLSYYSSNSSGAEVESLPSGANSVVINTTDNDYDQMLNSLFDLSDSDSIAFDFDVESKSSLS
jgi:hypothetical protein